MFAASQGLEEIINSLSVNAVWIASVLLILLTLSGIWVVKKRKEKLKAPIFVLIALTVSVTTLIIVGATVYLNIKSAAGGPVHWHADMEIWACGNELNLRDPSGISNKIGMPTVHEHNDKRMHIEGVPVTLPDDVSLGKFMQVIGGEVSNQTLVVPLNKDSDHYFENGEGQEDGDGNGAPSPQEVVPFIHNDGKTATATFVNGQNCGDKAAEVQVFVYSYNQDSKTYAQTKLANPATYGLTDAFDVPPGDCIIMEFAPPMLRTNKLCRSYGVKDIIRCEAFGVPTTEHSKCIDREVTPTVCAEQAKNPLGGITAECQALIEDQN